VSLETLVVQVELGTQEQARAMDSLEAKDHPALLVIQVRQAMSVPLEHLEKMVLEQHQVVLGYQVRLVQPQTNKEYSKKREA
jgi:hypothetical protein